MRGRGVGVGPGAARPSRSVRFALAGALLAAGGTAGQQPGTVHFSVILPANALVLEQEVRPPGQAPITHLRLETGDPVWTTETPGLPELPFVTRTVAVPPGGQIAGVTFNPGQGIPTQGVGLLYWAQLPRVGGDPQLPTAPDGSLDRTYYRAPDEVPPDPVIAQTQVFPPQLVEEAERRTVAGYQLVTYRVYPVQWYPASGLLFYYPQIDVDVTLTGGVAQAPTSYAAAELIDDVKAGVVNPDHVVGADPLSFPPGPDTRYLVITDNYRWSSGISKGAPVGDMVREFKRLAAWKNAKGVKAAVVTVTDIVRGRWGDFTTGARDLQEVIRNFLKFARREWSTYWVLLGGNVQVVPPREAAGFIVINDHYFRGTSDVYPKPNFYHYDAAGNTVRIHQEHLAIGIDTPIAALNSGKVFRRDIFAPPPSAAAPAWCYTDGTYTDTSYRPPGEYVLLRGVPADVNTTDFYAVTYATSIPTDLYYAALEGDDYDLPGLHDWDKNDNGVYGQYNWGALADVDGVSQTATVALGRATVADAVEAGRFVDKVLAYEKYDGVPADFGRTLVLTADDWYGGPAVWRSGSNPPEVGRYYSAADSTEAILHFDGPPGSKAAAFRLIAWNTAGDWWEVPFNLAASPTSLGYYYCTSDSCSSPSLITYSGTYTWELFAPTSFVRVVGPSDTMRPTYYFFDYTAADPAVTEKEQVRAKLATVAPGVDQRQRYYKDLLDTPDYPAPWLSMLSETAVRDALDGGVNLVSLSGHGWWGGCCGVSATWVPSLTNGFAGGVVYADSCLTNEFNKPKADDTSPDAAGERFLKGMDGGAAAYVGNTRYSLIGVGAVFERLFWNRLATTRHLGLLHKTKELYGAGDSERWVNYTNNLDGDPEMPLWTGKPLAITVIHPPELPSHAQALVTVTSGANQAVAGAVACITGPRGFFAVARTGGGGTAVLPLAGVRSGDELTVTVTGDGLIPYQGSLRVQDPARPHRRLPAHAGH
jgi:hypothetical protein